MAKIGMDFVGSLVPADAPLPPDYWIQAKGDIYEFRKVIEALKNAGSIAEIRADVLLKTIPDAAEGTKEKGAMIRLEYEKATHLQKYLLGWGGALQGMINLMAKRGDIIDGVEASDWSEIQFDLSITDYRQVSTLERVINSISIWNWGGIGYTAAEWAEITSGYTYAETVRDASANALSAIATGVSAAAAEAASAAVKALAQQAGLSPGELQKRITRAGNRVLKVMLFIGGGAILSFGLFGLLRATMRRTTVSVDVEVGKSKKGKQ